ncbi:peptidyl-prolyl cis-trans isomerase H-like [Echinops telfairi]|uniref:Peptidyl-prolyl cis-trans isomerase n=1 Tax=Echinops telfairi TaxID=9371 RepID=A0ABM0INL1_ECHTE|nr:peptidyl-prolyl cis-trans isomerase H-like [Echinops telfairi]
MVVANSSPVNPVVLFDASQNFSHMKIQLFADVVPRTLENFRQFCTGEFRKEGVPIHRLIKKVLIQGGDFANGDGTGVASIYRGPFADEKFKLPAFKLRHSALVLLSMANSGPKTKAASCQFFTTCSKCEWLAGKHMVFGKTIDGLLVMRNIESVPTGPNNKPRLAVVFSQCGEM